MSKISDLIATEAAAAETDSPIQTPLPDGVRVTRGHDRTKVLQVRLNDDEYRVLAKLADERDLPASTFARAILLQTIGR